MADVSESLTFKVGVDTTGFSRGMRRIKTSAKSTGQSMKSFAKGAFGALGGARGILTGASVGLLAMGSAATVASAAMFKLVNSTSEYIDKINIAAAQTGLTTGEVIAFSQKASEAGGSFDDIKGGLGFFTKAMNDVGREVETAQEAFGDLGVEVTDSVTGKMRPASVVIGEVLDKLGQMTSATERTAAAQTVFGARGAKITAILGTNSQALQDAAEKTLALAAAVQMGQRASKEMDVAVADLALASKTLSVTMGATLTPVVTTVLDVTSMLIDTFRESVGTIDENEDSVRAFALILGDNLVGAMQVTSLAFGAAKDAAGLFRLGVAAVSLTITDAIGTTADFAKITLMAADALLFFHKLTGDPLGIVEEVGKLADQVERVRDVSRESSAAFVQTIKDESAALGQGTKDAIAFNKKISASWDARRDAAMEAMEATGAEGGGGGGGAGPDDGAATNKMAADLKALSAIQESVAASMRSDIDTIIVARNAELDALDALANAHRDNLAFVDDVEKTKSDLIAVAEKEITALMVKEAVTRNAEILEQHSIEQESLQAHLDEQSRMQREFAEETAAINAQIFEGSVQGMQGLTDSTALLFEEMLSGKADRIDELRQKLQDSQDTLSKAQKRALKEQIKDEESAYKQVFLADQLGKIGQIAMATALAIMQGFAQLGPVGGAIAAVGIGALGVAQAGLVASERPPEFHVGGVVAGGAGALRPDEQLVKAQRGEGFLTQQGVRSVGGEEGLRAHNNGTATDNGPTVIQHVWSHRVLDVVIADNLKRNGPLRQATSMGRGTGRVNPYTRR